MIRVHFDPRHGALKHTKSGPHPQRLPSHFVWLVNFMPSRQGFDSDRPFDRIYPAENAAEYDKYWVSQPASVAQRMAALWLKAMAKAELRRTGGVASAEEAEAAETEAAETEEVEVGESWLESLRRPDPAVGAVGLRSVGPAGGPRVPAPAPLPDGQPGPPPAVRQQDAKVRSVGTARQHASLGGLCRSWCADLESRGCAPQAAEQRRDYEALRAQLQQRAALLRKQPPPPRTVNLHPHDPDGV